MGEIIGLFRFHHLDYEAKITIYEESSYEVIPMYIEVGFGIFSGTCINMCELERDWPSLKDDIKQIARGLYLSLYPKITLVEG